jgi:hydrogenase maturation protease
MNGRGCAITLAGAGNALISYDRIGARVLSAAHGRYGAEVELCDLGSSPLALLDHLHGQDLLLVVDAGLMGAAPGEVAVITAPVDAIVAGLSSVHQIGPLETLAVGARLYPERMPRRILVLVVETEGLDDAGEARAGEHVIAIVDEEIRAWYAAA